MPCRSCCRRFADPASRFCCLDHRSLEALPTTQFCLDVRQSVLVGLTLVFRSLPTAEAKTSVDLASHVFPLVCQSLHFAVSTDPSIIGVCPAYLSRWFWLSVVSLPPSVAAVPACRCQRANACRCLCLIAVRDCRHIDHSPFAVLHRAASHAAGSGRVPRAGPCVHCKHECRVRAV